ncbi:lysophospholipid acyltransferase family protein [Bacillus solimangrovi]|uniref:lysophospholipid acyltransferase family protein n=1 Tax=Bacillus solimangrovi TaxID=1305675 RepID=UPI000A9C8CAC|nr:lysophospholipid acyltransferase family protein [Bacillus solimangrovi]
MNLYKFGYVLVKGIFRTTYRVEVIGSENVPKDKGVLLCSNHISNFDPPMLGISFPRDVHYMAKEELFKLPVMKQVLLSLNAFPVRRGMSDKQALRQGLKLLKDGEVLGLFPEGTRSKTGELGEGMSGAGFFALRSNAEVVPAAIIGSYRPFSKVKVIIGEPIEMTKLREEKATAKDATEIIMSAIAKLIEKYK